MFEKLLSILVLWWTVLGIAQAEQYLTPKTEELSQQVSEFIYSNDYQKAQIIVSNHLEDTTLSLEEILYGYFLQADITKTAGNPQLAITLLTDASSILESLQPQKRLLYKALFYGNIAECYFNLLDYEQAQNYALQSVATHPTNALKDNGHAINHLILGYTHRLAKEYEQAARYYNTAIQSYKTTQNHCDLPLGYLKIADLYLTNEDYAHAAQYIDLSLAISDSCAVEQYILLSKLALVRLKEQQGDYKSSLQTLREVEQLRQAMTRAAQLQVVSELQIKHQTALAKAENEKLKQASAIDNQNTTFKLMFLSVSIIALLLLLLIGLLLLRGRRQKNAELEAQLEKINQQNKEREALLKEVHHRVKNNMQVITSLLHLQANDQSKSHRNPALLFQSSQNRINAMALVHEMLYQSGDVSKISLPTYIKDLAESLQANFQKSHQHINIDIQVPEVYLGLDTAIPLGLLLNELLSNAFTHGLSNSTKGHIEVVVNALGKGRYELLLGDNGEGLDCKDLLQYQSLGFSLVRKLVRQLQGEITLLDHTPGCHYSIAFVAVD